MGYGVGDYPLWQYFIMPFMAGIVGWGTNALALLMTFYPTEFVGVELYRIKNQPFGLFGWQGIIPSKCEKIASLTADIILDKLINVKEVFDKIDPVKLAVSMSDGALLMVDSVVNVVMQKYMPSVWQNLPEEVKDELVVLMDQELPVFISHLIKDMQENVYDILDIKHMSVQACVENKHLLNVIFQETGEQEFIFIRRSGFYFGFLFGLTQMTVWFFYNSTWVLPVFGFFVGWFTNFVALKLIFEPFEPKTIHCCGSGSGSGSGRSFVLQGLFLKRQKEVAVTYARVICVEIIHTPAIWDAILNGPKSANFAAMLRFHTIVYTERIVAGLRPLAVAAIGTARFAQLKEEVAELVAQRLPDIVDESYKYTTDAMDMETTLRQKLEALTPHEFERVLHPAFEEDEALLTLVGGILGAMVGVVQIFAVFE